MTDTSKLRSRISTLNRLLDDFDSQLDPLLAQSLPESLLPLSTIQQAKLQVTVPYLVYDLVIIYLKTKGIDPRTHPVFNELERVRQYIDKISNAENPETRKTTVDKAAANRFIKNAISQVKNQQQRDPGISDVPATNASGSSTLVPVKMTSKMLARAQYEAELKEALSDEEDEELDVFDAPESDEGSVEADVKGKGKELVVSHQSTNPQLVKKRRRPAMDPFTGNEATEATQTEASSSKKRKARSAKGPPNDDSNRSPAVPKLSPTESKKARKISKKSRPRSSQSEAE